MYRFIRVFVPLMLVLAAFSVVSLYIVTQDRDERQRIYSLRVTAAIETAVADALFGATRTAEADVPQYRWLVIEEGKPLDEVATEFGTTLVAIRMANGLLDDVLYGSGIPLVIPQGVETLDPPRLIRQYEAQPGDTLELIADRFDVPFEILLQDNAILAGRGVSPGDNVFLATILR